jgi:hypothetical protein
MFKKIFFILLLIGASIFISSNTLLKSESQSKSEFDTTYTVIIPTTYRVEYFDPTKYLTKQWMQLYEQNGEYFIDYAQYSFKKGMDECALMQTKTIESKRNTVVYFKSNTCTPGKIEHLALDNKDVLPTKGVTCEKDNSNLQFNSWKYLKPDILENSDNWSDYEDIRINFSMWQGDVELGNQPLFRMNECNDGYVTVKFIGDIDRDGKLDIIMHFAEHYEEETYIVYLSTLAKKGELVGELGRITRIFDC